MYFTPLRKTFKGYGWWCVTMFAGFGRLISLFLFFVAFPRSQGDDQVCSSVSDKSATYGSSILIECDSRASYKWWASSDGCESFSEYTACTEQNCLPTINESLGTSYHFCCTLNGVAQLTDSAQVSKCFHINVCIDVTDTVYPSLAFFGRHTDVFVQLHAEPPPTIAHLQVVYADSSPSDHSFLNVSTSVYPAMGDDVALLTYVFTFNIPEVDDVSTIDSAELEFTVTLDHEGTCPSKPITRSNIPVVQLQDAVVPRVTPSVVCPMPPTPTVVFITQEVSESESCSNEGLIAALVVVGAVALVIIALGAVAIFCLYRRIRTLKLKMSSEYCHIQHFTSTGDGHRTDPSEPTDPFGHGPPTGVPPPIPSNARPDQLAYLRQESQRPLLTSSGSAANTPMTPPTSSNNISGQNPQYAVPTPPSRLPNQATTPTASI